jgi:hypothetical protein
MGAIPVFSARCFSPPLNRPSKSCDLVPHILFDPTPGNFPKKALAKGALKKIDKKKFYLFILTGRPPSGSSCHANRVRSGEISYDRDGLFA